MDTPSRNVQTYFKPDLVVKLNLTRFRGHLKIGELPQRRSPNAEDQASLSAGVSC